MKTYTRIKKEFNKKSMHRVLKSNCGLILKLNWNLLICWTDFSCALLLHFK